MTMILTDNQDGKDALLVSYIDVANPKIREQLTKLKRQIDFLLNGKEK